jgi:aarF domain-containing kinase
MIAQQQHSWHARHGVATTTPSGATAQVGANVAALMQLAGDGSSDGSSGGGAHSFAPPPPPSSAQLVLLDFGLAEQLTPTVRHHFVSFLNAISAGDGLAASRHLLRWSRRQACADRRAFAADVVDLFQAACDIHSPDGIDLDHVSVL